MKKIGLFGGSFDPITLGHLNLAVCLQEAHHLDEVFFAPANLSPFKGAAPPHVSTEHRREMVRLAIAPFPTFQLLDWELDRPGPSYTIDTVRAFLHQNKDVSLHLLLGEDILSRLPLWKEIEALIALAPPYIGSRHGGDPEAMPLLSEASVEILSQGVTPIPLIEISSTQVRERLSKNKICRHLLPGNVLDYIERNRLYSIAYENK